MFSALASLTANATGGSSCRSFAFHCGRASPPIIAGRSPKTSESLRETFSVSDNDFFATVDELESRDLIYDRKYFNIEHTDDLVLIQLTVSNTRTVEHKKALYHRIVERLGKNPGLRPQDIFLNLLEVAKENWSFGNGEAQYA